MVRSFSLILRRLFWGLLAVALIVFSVNNRHGVDISFYPLDFSLPGPVPVYIILFFGIFIGLLVASSVSSYMRLQGFAKRRKAERRVSTLESEMDTLSEEAHKVRAAEGHALASPDSAQERGLANRAEKPL